MKVRTLDLAINKWPGILSHFGVDQSFLRNRHGPCPMCGGDDRFRFDDKDGRGTWYCNKCGAGTGIDLLKLITGREFKDLAKEIDSVVGRVENAPQPEKRDPSIRLNKIREGTRMVVSGDDVSKYLSGRGLSVPSHGIRIHPSQPYWEDGERVGFFPCMVATFVDKNGKPVTYHLTYLSKGAKAPVSQPKKLVTPKSTLDGGAVRLSTVCERVGIAEGLETALAVTTLYGVPCWAATTAGLLEKFAPPEGVKAVAVYADNDANFVGQSAAFNLARRLTNEGYSVEVYWPPITGTDWCDVLAAYRSSAQVDTSHG